MVQPWLDLTLSLGWWAGQWAEQSQAPAKSQVGGLCQSWQVGPDQQVAEGRQEAGGDVSDVSSICDPHPACDIMTHCYLVPRHVDQEPSQIMSVLHSSNIFT